ncbi:MAG: extracellular solute-binding protein [Ruminococcaceae bacterium]|nr:extracellular solute-binding protein [Oscillospiraceae bacterium]
MKGCRFLSALLLLILCLSILSACHGSRALDPFELPAEFDAEKNYEITFWAKNDTNINQTRIYQKAIEEFQTRYPNITVSLKLYTNYGNIYNDVITNIATQTTPNVCITYPDHIATYLTGTNTVVPLDGLFEDPRYGLGGSELRFDGPTKEEMIPKFLSECTIGGTHYAIPYMRSTEACYINRTLVEKLGYTLPETLTWDFIFEVSAAATEKDADGNYVVNGQKTLIPFLYKSTDNMMIQMLKQKGATYSTDEGQILLFHDETKEILQSLEPLAGSGAFSTFSISSYPANFLNAGQCIFAIDSTAGATWMGTDAPLCDINEDKLVPFDIEVMSVPQYDPENPWMISQGPSICVFNKRDNGEVLASWLFAQYLLTNEVQIPYAQTEGYVPVTSKAQNSEIYQDYLSREGEDNALYYDVKLKATKLLLNYTDRTFVTPVFNGSASLRNAAGQLIESVTKSMRRKEQIDEAYYPALYEKMISLYRLDQGATMTVGQETLGPLPTTSVVLLSSLGGIWLLMAGYVAIGMLKKRKK